MSSTCLYIFTKGDKAGHYCTVYPRYGQYCAKHKKYDKEHFNLVDKIQNKQQDFKLSKFHEGMYINWDTKIVFLNNKPIGKYVNPYSDTKLFPLLESDIKSLENWGVNEDYKIDEGYFKKKFFPKNLSTFFVDPNSQEGIKKMKYPYVVDTETDFVYKHDKETDTFDFYGILKGIDRTISQDINNYMIKLLEIIDIYNIPSSKINLIRKRSIPLPRSIANINRILSIPYRDDEKTFKITYKVESQFFKMQKQDICSICYEKKSVYYSKVCEKPHPCCKECWKSNKQNTCPFCRKALYN